MEEPIVEIKGKKYVLWHYEDEYKVNESIHATPLKDWKRLQKKFADMDTYYYEFCGIFIRDYEDLKESIQEMEDFDE